MTSMKHVINKVIVSLAVLSAGFIPAQVGAAGSASFALSPNNTNKAINSTFSVAIYENSGTEAVNSVQADLTYDANQLQYVSFSGGAFSCPIVNIGGGMMSIGCANFSGSVTGNQLVGSITFKAIANGNSAISMNQSSIIARSSDATDIWNHGSVTGAMTVYTPAAQPAVKKTAAATTTVAPTPTEASKEEVKAAETAKNEGQAPALPAAVEDDTVSVWAYLAVFLGATAVAAGIVYRDNLKKLAQGLRSSMGAKAAPVAVVAGAAAAKKAPAKKKAPTKKKPATKKK